MSENFKICQFCHERIPLNDESLTEYEDRCCHKHCLANYLAPTEDEIILQLIKENAELKQEVLTARNLAALASGNFNDIKKENAELKSFVRFVSQCAEGSPAINKSRIAAEKLLEKLYGGEG